ncbi:MAG: hypothetical protein ACLFPE_07940 [Bacteroidales bacterium]
MINIFGLSVGLAAFVLISVWIYNELSYNAKHDASTTKSISEFQKFNEKLRYYFRQVRNDEEITTELFLFPLERSACTTMTVRWVPSKTSMLAESSRCLCSLPASIL